MPHASPRFLADIFIHWPQEDKDFMTKFMGLLLDWEPIGSWWDWYSDTPWDTPCKLDAAVLLKGLVNANTISVLRQALARKETLHGAELECKVDQEFGREKARRRAWQRRAA